MPEDLWCTGFLREGLPAFFVIASAPIGARGAGAVERGVAEACFQQPWTHKGSSVRDTEAKRGRPEVEAAPHRTATHETCPTLQQVTHVTEELRFQKQVLSTDTLPRSWAPPCGSGCSTEQSTTGSSGWVSNTHGTTPTKLSRAQKRRCAAVSAAASLRTFHPFVLL